MSVAIDFSSWPIDLVLPSGTIHLYLSGIDASYLFSYLSAGLVMHYKMYLLRRYVHCHSINTNYNTSVFTNGQVHKYLCSEIIIYLSSL